MLPRTRNLDSIQLTCVAYVLSALVTLVLAHAVFDQPIQWSITTIVIPAGVAILLALLWVEQAGAPTSRAFEVLFILFALLSGVMAWCNTLPQLRYGDGDLFVQFLTAGFAFPRWLLGMFAAISLYVGVWQFPAVTAHVPPEMTAATFSSLLCVATMAVSAVAILRYWPGRLALVVPMLTPVWVLFGSGYIEYYPLMIGGWLAVLAWTFDRPIEERTPMAIGSIAALVSLLYAGFAPFSVLLVAAFVYARPSKALPAVATGAAVFAVAVTACGTTIPAFLRSLYVALNLGDRMTAFPRYVGRSAGPNSIFFSVKYAFKPSHLADISYMTFWGAGWLVVMLCLVAATVGAARLRDPAIRADARVWLGLAVMMWQLFYLLFMIPKLGPTRDIDLFCPTYVAGAFFAGLLLDQSALASRWRQVVLGGIAGATMTQALFLVWIGLPLRP